DRTDRQLSLGRRRGSARYRPRRPPHAPLLAATIPGSGAVPGTPHLRGALHLRRSESLVLGRLLPGPAETRAPGRIADHGRHRLPRVSDLRHRYRHGPRAPILARAGTDDARELGAGWG